MSHTLSILWHMHSFLLSLIIMKCNQSEVIENCPPSLSQMKALCAHLHLMELAEASMNTAYIHTDTPYGDQLNGSVDKAASHLWHVLYCTLLISLQVTFRATSASCKIVTEDPWWHSRNESLSHIVTSSICAHCISCGTTLIKDHDDWCISIIQVDANQCESISWKLEVFLCHSRINACLMG